MQHKERCNRHGSLDLFVFCLGFDLNRNYTRSLYGNSNKCTSSSFRCCFVVVLLSKSRLGPQTDKKNIVNVLADKLFLIRRIIFNKFRVSYVIVTKRKQRQKNIRFGSFFFGRCKQYAPKQMAPRNWLMDGLMDGTTKRQVHRIYIYI